MAVPNPQAVGGQVWGRIIGDLGQQADLNGALAQKAPLQALDLKTSKVDFDTFVLQVQQQNAGLGIVHRIVNDADYTLTYEDLNAKITYILMNAVQPRTVRYPTQAVVSHPLLKELVVVWYGSGAVSVTALAGVQLLSKAQDTSTVTLAGRGSIVRLSPIAIDVISVTGDIVPGSGPTVQVPGIVTGSAVKGSLLTFTPSVCSPDGTRARQWLREHRTTGALTNVGAGALTYTTVDDDEDNYVWVRETITDTAGRFVVASSNKITIVPAGITYPQNSTLPSILPTSSAVAGGDVYVDAGDWTNSPTSFDFQKYVEDVLTGAVVNQASRVLTYTSDPSEGGKRLRFTVIAKNANGFDPVAKSTGDWALAQSIPLWVNTPLITVQGGGAPVYGCTLVCSDGVTTPITALRERQWEFLDVSNPQWYGPVLPIATGATYTTTADDIGSRMSCRVRPRNGNVYGDEVIALGPVIEATAPPPPPPPEPPPASVAGCRIPTGSLLPSGPITVSADDTTISGRLFSAANATHITILPGVIGTKIYDCELTGATNSAIVNQGTDTSVQFCDIYGNARGVLTHTATGALIEYNDCWDFSTGSQFEGHAIETIYSAGPTTIRYNRITGTNYKSDALSTFQSSNVSLTHNYFNVQIDEPSGAAFTMGDALTQSLPGSNNYVAFNTVLQTGGVPAGVFGSNGNTVLEFNCFSAGIQAYDYNGNNFIGVIIRQNVINMTVSYIPMPASAYGGTAAWSTNIDSTDCNLVPTP